MAFRRPRAQIDETPFHLIEAGAGFRRHAGGQLLLAQAKLLQPQLHAGHQSRGFRLHFLPHRRLTGLQPLQPLFHLADGVGQRGLHALGGLRLPVRYFAQLRFQLRNARRHPFLLGEVGGALPLRQIG